MRDAGCRLREAMRDAVSLNDHQAYIFKNASLADDYELCNHQAL